MTEPTNGERLTSIHIKQAIDKDRASTAWLVSRFTPLLLCQARHRTPASLARYYDPEDLASDVWMVVLPALPELEPSGGSLSRGLIRFASTVLVRRIRDLVEKHVLGKPPLAPDAGPEGALSNVVDDTRDVVSHVVAQELKGRVWACLDELDAADREIMVLRGIESRSHKDVAARVGLTPENAAGRYYRVLARLRELLPESVFEDLEP